MLDNLVRIAVTDHSQRREQLIAILTEIDCPFSRHRSHAGRLRPENITVRFGNQVPRLVLCAHYDNVQGSTGANDNAASVGILLELIAHYTSNPPKIPLEFVFFDLEEREFAGSWAYTQSLMPDEIIGAINLDLCGVGDTLAVAPQEIAEQAWIASAIAIANQKIDCPVQIIKGSFPSDHMAFQHVNIPAIMISMIPTGDLPLVEATAQEIVSEKRPSVFETMHNGPRDSIDVIQESAMKCVLEWVDVLVQQL